MDVQQKIIDALRDAVDAEYVRLQDEDGISGFVVSRRFEGVSTFDRQTQINRALRKGPTSLTREEQKRVLMIAGLTPTEYDAVGAHIRVVLVRELKSGFEIQLRGAPSDAEYVRGALNKQKGIKTTEPKPVAGAIGTLMSFRAKGTEASPISKQRVIRVLSDDPYVEVGADA